MYLVNDLAATLLLTDARQPTGFVRELFLPRNLFLNLSGRRNMSQINETYDTTYLRDKRSSLQFICHDGIDTWRSVKTLLPWKTSCNVYFPRAYVRKKSACLTCFLVQSWLSALRSMYSISLSCNAA